MTPLLTNGLETASSSRDASSFFTLNREQEYLLDTPAAPSVAAATPLTTPVGTALPPGRLLFQCPAGFALPDFDPVYLLSIPRPSDMLQFSDRCFLQLLPPALSQRRCPAQTLRPSPRPACPRWAPPACLLLPSAALLPWTLAQPFPTSSRLFISLKGGRSPGWSPGLTDGQRRQPSPASHPISVCLEARTLSPSRISFRGSRPSGPHLSELLSRAPATLRQPPSAGRWWQKCSP